MEGTFSALGHAYRACPVATAHAEHEATARQARDQQRTTAWIATQLAGVGFRTRDQMRAWAETIATQTLGRALTAEERERFAKATRELWAAAHPVEVYELTPLGREALNTATCADCLTPIDPLDYLCASCAKNHVAPVRSHPLAGAA